MPTILRCARAVALGVLLSACSRSASTVEATPAPDPGPPLARTAPPDTLAAAGLPAIPLADGPLAIRVQYPPANAAIGPSTNFIFGSLGTGRASLTINGDSVRVYPNGAFMGWIPVPRGATPAYDLVARTRSDSARLVHPLRAPAATPGLPTTGRLIVDSSEFAGRATLMLRDDERTTLAVRAPANARAVVVIGRDTIPVSGSNGRFALTADAARLRAGGQFLVIRDRDTVRVGVPPLAGAPSDARRWVTLGPGIAPSDSDAVIYGRPGPNDTYRYFWLPGTTLEVTGRTGSFTRVRLDGDQEAWVANADAADATTGPGTRTTANARVRAAAQSADLVIPMTAVPAYLVEEKPGVLEITLYDTRGNSDVIGMPTADSLVRHVTWEQIGTDRVRYTLHLSRRPLGYHVMWERGALVLRVRRPPVVDPSRPLQGLTIALDPGHPPAGSTGPTHLYEGQAVLWVAERARRMLEAQGARVVMTRTTMDTLQLHPRRQAARRADAHAFVSIHLNAYPDGVNPFTAPNGTSTYFYRTHAEPLARATQQGMLRSMGLADEGIFFRSLSVVVQTWMPAILTEGAYVIIPEQEAAFRTTGFQDRYARGIVDGLAAYFREIGR